MRRIIIHPFAIALWPLLSLYIHNRSELLLADVLWTILLVFIFVALFWWAINLLVKDVRKSALISFIFFGLFFSFRNILMVIGAWFLRLGWISDPMHWLYAPRNVFIWFSLWVGFLAFAGFAILKYKRSFEIITQYLNVVSLLLVFMIAFLWLKPVVQSWNSVNPEQAVVAFIDGWLEQEAAPISFDQELLRAAPDIYYLILDGYARQDILRDVYDFDNEPFLAALSQRGFFVAEQSRANYHRTLLSLASSLNMTHLNPLTAELGNFDGYGPLQYMIQGNSLFRELKNAGYRTVAFEAGYQATELKNADEYITIGRALNSFQHETINMTPLSLVLIDYQYDYHRSRITNAFQRLPEVALDGQPTLVFAHLISPHPPFVFDAAGNPIRPNRWYTVFDADDFLAYGSREEYLRGYRDQLEYVNQQVLTMVDRILANAEGPVVIILQADHGPGSMFNFASLEESYLPERMSILNAYYFSDQNYENLYETITPVNSFRVILNQFLGANLSPYADHSYFSVNTTPYQLIDITQRLDEAKFEIPAP